MRDRRTVARGSDTRLAMSASVIRERSGPKARITVRPRASAVTKSGRSVGSERTAWNSLIEHSFVDRTPIANRGGVVQGICAYVEQKTALRSNLMNGEGLPGSAREVSWPLFPCYA